MQFSVSVSCASCVVRVIAVCKEPQAAEQAAEPEAAQPAQARGLPVCCFGISWALSLQPTSGLGNAKDLAANWH